MGTQGDRTGRERGILVLVKAAYPWVSGRPAMLRDHSLADTLSAKNVVILMLLRSSASGYQNCYHKRRHTCLDKQSGDRLTPSPRKCSF